MQKIWFKPYQIEELDSVFAKYMTGYLDIKATEITDNELVASMPISDKVKQPFGVLHGGASVVLAESVGSIASNLILDPDKQVGVGMEINANHLKPVHQGMLFARCSLLHQGKKTHVWDIKIRDEEGDLICISRLTVAIIEKK